MPTDIATSAASGVQQISTVLKRASASTGADFNFLLNMASRESSLDPHAKAKTSSAAGLFQFIEQTWLGALKTYGAQHGLGDYAGDISRAADGRFKVNDAERRDEILNLRFNPDVSAALAGELANENKSILERRLGRATTSADLYAAHFLGPAGAVKLLAAASKSKAADLLPAAANANRHVFFEGARARTVGEVIRSIASSMNESQRAQSVEPSAQPAPQFTARAAPASVDHSVVAETRTMERAPTIEPARAPYDFNAAPPSPVRLSALMMTVLNALDVSRLASGRHDRESDKF